MESRTYPVSATGRKAVTDADIIIIGGGAAGLMAAYGACSEGNRKVTVLEKMPRPGRKIMITGKGRCNFTNVKEWPEFSGHVHPKPNFLKPAFYTMKPEAVIGLLEDHGLKCVTERGDRAFPESHKASDVVDTLSYMARCSGAEILCGKEVLSIRADMGNGLSGKDHGSSPVTRKFVIGCSDGSTYCSDRLIITTGGLSYPGTGSTGDGYGWAESVGHRITERFPSLTALVPEGYKQVREGVKASGHIDRNTPLSEYGKSLCGISLRNVGISLVSGGNTIQEEFGDLDFTDGGIEGPIGFRISRNCVERLLKGQKVSVTIDLKPAVALTDLASRTARLWQEIAEDRRSRGKQYGERLKVLAEKLMPLQLIPAFMKSHPNTDHTTIARMLKNWKMEIAGYVGYERCVITAGGVDTSEVSSRTMESRICSGLYFAGEVLDLDGDTGGYNLQIAFCTGYLAGRSAIRKD